MSAEDVKKLIYVYDVTKPIVTDYECVTLSIRPNVPICLYPTKQGKSIQLMTDPGFPVGVPTPFWGGGRQ